MKKRKFAKFLLLVIFSVSGQLTFAQANPDEMVKKFFAEYSKDGIETALDNLYATSEWIGKAGSSVQTLKIKMQEQLAKDVMGNYNGNELIARKQLGESYVILSYMAKYDRQPIRFTFQFYKPKDKWSMYSFEYDGNLSAEMEEAIKVH